MPLDGDDDEEYGAVDAYMDDVLGTPMEQRPAEWRGKSVKDAEVLKLGHKRVQ